MRQLKITQSYTNRDSSLNTYLKEVAKLDLVDTNEEIELAEKIKQGDQKALDKLVCANLRFVISVAKQYQHQGLSLLDLIDEGNVGLIKAAQKFDPTKGFKFISYAVWWIRQSILLALSQQSRNIKLPMNQIGNLSKVTKASSKFEQIHNRKPSITELAKETSLSEEKVINVLQASSKNVSINTNLGDEDAGTLLDILPNEDSPSADYTTEDESVSIEITRVLNSLYPRESDIIKMLFGIGCEEQSLENVSEKFNVTKERIRQIKETALKKLKTNVNSYKILKTLL